MVHLGLVPPPHLGVLVGLHGVSACAAGDVWAVGSKDLDGSGLRITSTQHWNGSRWRGWSATTRRATSGAGYLVGLTEHWNGTRWSVVSSPNHGESSCGFGLSSVSGSGTGNVWTSGTRSCSADVTPEMLRWNGSRWSSVAIPATGFDNPAR